MKAIKSRLSFSVDAKSVNGRQTSHKMTERLHQSVVERSDVINRLQDVLEDKSRLSWS